MRDAMVAAVEEHTGGKVVAFMSDIPGIVLLSGHGPSACVRLQPGSGEAR